ncbi:MAG: alpha/beta hydrolase [Alphaproteobacteria bacterium]
MSTIHNDLLGCEQTFVDTGKYRSRIIEKGEGTPLILMHGGGGHAETYARNMDRLSKVCHPIAIDFIWHGMSSAPKYDEGNWLKQFTDQILNFMDHRGIEKAFIEGESLGGWIVYDMAINHPDRVAGAILNTAWGMKFKPGAVEETVSDLDSLRTTSLNALNNPNRETIKARLDWLMPLGGATDELVELRYKLWTIPQTKNALLEYYDRLFHPSCQGYLFNEEHIQTISVPTLVLWTDKNPFHGEDVAEYLKSLIKGSDLHIMRNAAHWPQWELPEEHDEVVTKFIQKND